MDGKLFIKREWKIATVHLQTVSNYLTSAYSDYLAARLLLNSNCLLQGTVQANTCIEKYFKALMFSVNKQVPKNHNIDSNKFLNTIKNKFQEVYLSLNIEFIQLLSKSYTTRYLDQLPKGFNLVIVGMKVLSELDRVVEILEYSLQSTKLNSEKYHEKLISAKDERLLLNNLTLDSSKKVRKSKVFEMRKFTNNDIIQLQYDVDKFNFDGKFNHIGLRPQSNGSNEYKIWFSK